MLEQGLKGSQGPESTLNGERVYLRFFRDADAQAVATLAGDARIAETTTSIPHPYSLADAKDWIAQHAELRRTCLAFHWAVVQRAQRRVVGAVSVEVSLRDRTGHLGYWIGHDYWRNGFGLEAARLATSWAFQAGFKKIAARCIATNRGSSAILERCGFAREGCLKGHVLRNGERADVLCYGALLTKG